VNRRLVSRLAKWHFAATPDHARNLRREGVPRDCVFRTGNPVVDSLQTVLKRGGQSDRLRAILAATEGLKRVAVTTHRRESFGERLAENLWVLRRFVERHRETAVVFPVHPNPVVREHARSILGGVDRVHLTDPFDYPDFIALLSASWVIASDSGGVQEEAPSLGKPLFILRDNTERPEVLDTGLAKLCPTAESFADLLEEAHRTDATAKPTTNPFGDGRAGRRIVRLLRRVLSGQSSGVPEVAE
jgi:UDP-N-acetylglucosamine 2-epimerase (non-hydrolysing)